MEWLRRILGVSNENDAKVDWNTYHNTIQQSQNNGAFKESNVSIPTVGGSYVGSAKNTDARNSVNGYGMLPVGGYNALAKSGGTGGVNTSGSTVLNTGSGGQGADYAGLYNQYLGELTGDIERSYQQLMELAKGDFDFAAKWIETQYKKALGSNDAETKAFLKSVASKLEEDSGRIVYDYETGKYFAEKEYNQGTRNVQEAKQIALGRLAEDEKIANENLDRQALVERRNQNANLNARGLINDSRDDTSGLGGMFIGEQEDDIQSRYDAIARARQRGEQDTNVLARIDQENLDFAKEKAMEGLTTRARRGGIDAIHERDYQREKAERERKRQEMLAQQQKDSALAQARDYAAFRAREHI